MKVRFLPRVWFKVLSKFYNALYEALEFSVDNLPNLYIPCKHLTKRPFCFNVLLVRYSLKTLRTEFPDNASCLDFIFRARYPKATGYYRVSTRMCYSNSAGNQIYPLKGTIFERSSTPLTLWFHAIFLFYVSKNGISAAELQRQLGVTYKTAFRMGHKIRSVMKQGDNILTGIVEADETYIGGKNKQKEKFSKKAVVFGMVERKGQAKALHVPHRGTEILIPNLVKHVSKEAHLMTDEARVYQKTPKVGFSKHSYVKHGKGHYVRGDVYTNSVEGFWGLLKPSLMGTHRGVSKKYLQKYLDEHVWRYNQRLSPSFSELLSLSVSGTS